MEQNYIGENIRIYRERANLTQQQLADKVGVSWEMVSRYERSINSPFKKINRISNALNISKSLLMEKHVPNTYSNIEHRVPLFIQLPMSHKLNSDNTNYYYICPEWILKRDRECIAIDSSLIECEYDGIKKNGITYLSIQSKLEKDDLVLIRSNQGLSTKKYTNQIINVMGKVLAQEIRY